jgi:hypothetical protein
MNDESSMPCGIKYIIPFRLAFHAGCACGCGRHCGGSAGDLWAAHQERYLALRDWVMRQWIFLGRFLAAPGSFFVGAIQLTRDPEIGTDGLWIPTLQPGGKAPQLRGRAERQRMISLVFSIPAQLGNSLLFTLSLLLPAP